MTAPTTGFEWNEARKQELIEMVNAGRSAGYIGKIFGVTRSAVCGKVNRMGMHLGGEKRNRPASVPKPKPPKRRDVLGFAYHPNGITQGRWEANKEKQTAPIAKPVNGKHVHILELRPQHCRWPMWSHKERSSQQYCAAPKIEGSPYCEAHFRKSRAANG